MKLRAQFILAVTGASMFVAAAVGTSLYTLRGTLPDAQQAPFDAALGAAAGALAFVFMLVVATLAWLLHAFYDRHVASAQRLAEESNIILSANPAHRIAEAPTAQIALLRDAINAFASRLENLGNDVEARVAAARADLDQEKTRLAALMSQLSESVVVCNVAARVLLYNPRAQDLLSACLSEGAAAPVQSALGLGRSLFSVIERSALSHAIEDLQYRLERGETAPVSVFITRLPGARMLRVRMAPVLTPAPALPDLSGFILIIEDVTREVEMGVSRESQLRSLIARTRATLGNIGAATGSLLVHPDMDMAKQRSFLEIVAQETRALGSEVARVEAGYRAVDPALESIGGADFLAVLKRGIENQTGLLVSSRADDAGCAGVWLAIDRAAMIDVISRISLRLRTQCAVREVALSLTCRGGHAELDLTWRGATLSLEAAREWQNGASDAGASLDDVMKQHRAEALYGHDEAAGHAYFRVLLPVSVPNEPRVLPPELASRPTFYDFDLFHQPRQSAAGDARALTELSYTVFDTETTGLAPSHGDQIVSIGAVRIVNGKRLAGEMFDQLVNPRRRLSASAVRIHGITDDMVERAPTIDRALPAFHRYCEDTVLVAHNAAFDLRFLQLKEDETGVCFDHPVLDTLMLSAVVHPGQADHTLEAIATRLGVDVVGRHTALGDALVTAEIFLRMLPLLAMKDIRTLGEAREAARSTPFARLAY